MHRSAAPRIVATLITTIFASACSLYSLAEAGIDSREVPVQAYDRIHLVGSAELRLVQHDSKAALVPNVRVSGSAASLQSLVIESADGLLFIDASDEPAADTLVIQAGVHQLREVLSEGGARVSVDGLAVETLALEGRGASQFNLRRVRAEDLIVIGEGISRFVVSGTVENQYVDMSGAGAYLANELTSQTSQVNVWGGGLVELWVEKLLDVNVFGNAQVSYGGTPWVLQNLYGTGAIKPATDGKAIQL